ncbi:MAG: sugar ABC transporter substrate-binding protein [Clostridiales bacterium]|nr:sugar ABC transporter substrate-binding protein [Clostridiales bacterium]
MKRKLFAIMMTGALAVGMLAGCGSSSSSDSDTTVAEDTTEDVSEAVSEAVEEVEEEVAEATTLTDVTIGFSTPSLSIEFCANMEAAVQEACAERGWDVVALDCGTDGATQVSQCEDLISQGVDAILIFPYAPDACASIGADCADAGIPLITVESTIDTYDAAVLTDMYEVGVAQAEKAMELVGDDVKPVVLEGPTSQTTMIELMNGAVETFEAAGIEVVDVQVGENTIDTSQQIVENWISAGLDFNCIISSSDGSSSGAINALKDADMLDEVTVISENGDTIGIELIQDGELACTVSLPSANYGYLGVEVIEKILSGEDYDEITYLNITWIDSSNVDEYAE